jgi:hypothetical protein
MIMFGIIMADVFVIKLKIYLINQVSTEVLNTGEGGDTSGLGD